MQEHCSCIILYDLQKLYTEALYEKESIIYIDNNYNKRNGAMRGRL